MIETVVPGYDEALARLGGDRDLMSELVELFRIEARETLGRIGDAILREDAEELRQAAHLLRGHLAAIGATDYQQVAHRLETRGRVADLRGIEADFSGLERGVEKLLEELRPRPAPKTYSGCESP